MPTHDIIGTITMCVLPPVEHSALTAGYLVNNVLGLCMLLQGPGFVATYLTAAQVVSGLCMCVGVTCGCTGSHARQPLVSVTPVY